MKKLFLLSALALFMPLTTTFAQEQAKVKLKPYGFVRTYTVFDTRINSSGTQDLFYYCPKDELKPGTEDLNSQSSLKMVSLTSRLGLDITGFEYNNMKLSGKIEADFYNMNGNVAVFRLRQAFVNMKWDNLWNRNSNTLSLVVGQKWHPMAVDMPYFVNLETAVPFNPFNRSPQITADLGLGNNFTLTGSLLYQMQYVSTGPIGKKSDYIKYSCVPEIYLGMSFKNGGFMGKVGVDMLNIKPRNNDGNVKVSDRIMTISPFLYAQYKTGLFSINAKTILAEAGEHLNLLSGYGVSKINSDKSWEYTPMRSTASFVSVKYGKKVQFMATAGYMKLLGTKDELYADQDGLTSGKYYFFNTAGAKNLNQMFRITPTVCFNFGKLALAFEYNMTTAQFGKFKGKDMVSSNNGLVEDGLHWITNHRVLGMLKYTF